MREKTKDILTFLEYYVARDGYLYNFHLNDVVLEFYDVFYPNGKLTNRNKFRYYANKLVELGVVQKCRRVGTGYLGFYDFGVKTAGIWETNKKYSHDEIKVLYEEKEKIKRKYKNLNRIGGKK